METMNNTEQKAWDKYKNECDEWELVTTLLSRATKHREDIEFSLPSLWRWYYSLCDEVAEKNKKVKDLENELYQVNEEIESLR